MEDTVLNKQNHSFYYFFGGKNEKENTCQFLMKKKKKIGNKSADLQNHNKLIRSKPPLHN